MGNGLWAIGKKALRPRHGKRRVSAHLGWAGEKIAVLSILREYPPDVFVFPMQLKIMEI